MPEVDDYFKLAASNFKIAEAYLEDAECSLRTLQKRLENSLELLRKIPRDESLLMEQFSQTTNINEVQLVSH